MTYFAAHHRGLRARSNLRAICAGLPNVLSLSRHVPSRAGQTDTRILRSTRGGSPGPTNGTRSAAVKSWAARRSPVAADNRRRERERELLGQVPRVLALT